VTKSTVSKSIREPLAEARRLAGRAHRHRPVPRSTRPGEVSRGLRAAASLAAAYALLACGRTDLGLASGGGGSGGASSGCQIDAGCARGEHCDITHACVPTPAGCASDADCAAPTPSCRVDTHTCVPCTNSAECPAGDQCSDYHCYSVCAGGVECAAGLTCCGPLCVDETNDPDNCGGCAQVCGPLANATAVCVGSTCGLGACAPGFADCDGDPANGCETNLLSDGSASCGACGHDCAYISDCALGVCVGGCGGEPGMCPPGDVCCGTLPLQAHCSNPPTDPYNCGACGNICPYVIPNGSDTCLAGSCQIVVCDTGFADCDHLIDNGCEVQLGSDPANCGTCGSACGPGSPCLSGVCQAVTCPTVSCPQGLACCGTSCIDLDADVEHCGACGNVCPEAQACIGGECVASKRPFDPNVDPTYLSAGLRAARRR
jgi:Stigma-specific protein, Stig1